MTDAPEKLDKHMEIYYNIIIKLLIQY